jgi:hypothetical protein
MNCLDLIVVFFYYGYAGGIVVGCSSFGGCCLSKSLAKVEPESVQFIFCKPVFQHPFKVSARAGVIMVEIVKHAVWMGCGYIKPGVCRGGCTSLPVHLCERMLRCCVIKHDVEYNRHSALMCFVDKSFVIVFGSIGFIRGKVETGIVSPAVVPVEFLNGHKLDGIHAKTFQVIEFGRYRIDGAFGGKVAHQQFVYNKLVGRRSGKVGCCPGISRFPGLNNRYNSFGQGRVGFQVRINRSGDIAVVGRVEYLF